MERVSWRCFRGEDVPETGSAGGEEDGIADRESPVIDDDGSRGVVTDDDGDGKGMEARFAAVDDGDSENERFAVGIVEMVGS